MAVPASLRKRVVRRAKQRCEYCGLSQVGQAATFHVDHIMPQVVGGASTLENLALACVHCSLRKGARQTARDSQSGRTARLFHPREHSWNHHFRWMACRLNGITAIGRATVDALNLNSAEHQIIRVFEKKLGRHPPPGQL